MKDVLEVCEKPLVSLDFKGSFVSSSIDASLTMVMGDDMVKVVAWCVLSCNSQDLSQLLALARFCHSQDVAGCQS